MGKEWDRFWGELFESRIVLEEEWVKIGKGLGEGWVKNGLGF